MPSSTLSLRAGGLIVTAALATGLAGCASEPELKFIAPTMAPEQTLSEACALTGDEVDQLTIDIERQIKQGIEQAATDLASGTMPSFDFLSMSVDGTLVEIEDKITNTEVHGAVEDVRGALQGFPEIPQPDSLLGVPGFLGSLGSQLNELLDASNALRSLCIVGPDAEAESSTGAN